MTVVQFPSPKQPADFAFKIGETVEAMFRGEIVERIENAHGVQYLVKQTLDNGKTAFQRVKQEHTFEIDEGAA